MIKKILIVAGGTGGHIFPALAIAESLQKQGVLVYWLGAESGMEKKLVPACYPITLLPIQALRGKKLNNKCMMPFRLCRAIFLACRCIQKMNPDVVLGMGGYASGPGGIAAKLLRKPLVIHEQNAIAGLTNRLLARFADRVLQAFPNTFPKKIHAMTVGNPVRNAIFTIPTPENRFQHRALPLRLLILGGSQGAQAINQLIPAMLNHFAHPESILIWHQTGKNDFESVKQAYSNHVKLIYKIDSFIDEMSEAYAWADLVIARAGALTISELAAAGVPSFLIPYPFAVDHHQDANAAILAKIHAAKIFPQDTTTPEILSSEIQKIVNAPTLLRDMAMRAKMKSVPDAVIQIEFALKSLN